MKELNLEKTFLFQKLFLLKILLIVPIIKIEKYIPYYQKILIAGIIH